MNINKVIFLLLLQLLKIFPPFQLSELQFIRCTRAKTDDGRTVRHYECFHNFHCCTLQTTLPTSTRTKKRKAESEFSEGKKHYCMLHGNNNSHNSEDCTVLKSQAKKMRGMCKAQPNERRAQHKQTQELQAIVASSVARAMKSIKKKGKVKKSSKKSRKTSTDEFNAFENMSLSDDSDKSNNSEEEETVSVTQSSDSASESSENSE